MDRINVDEALKYAVGRVKANPAFYILGFLIALLIPLTVSALIITPVSAFFSFVHLFFKAGSSLTHLIILALKFSIFCFVSGPLFFGYLKGIKKEADGGHASLMDVFSGVKELGPVVVFNATVSILTSIGFMLYLIPGILLLPIMPMGLYFLSEGLTSSYGVDAIIKAFRNWSLKLELLILVVFGASVLAGCLLCCGIGLAVTLPIAMVMVWTLCRQAYGARPEPPAAPAAPPSVTEDQIGTPS